MCRGEKDNCGAWDRLTAIAYQTPSGVEPFSLRGEKAQLARHWRA